MKKYLLFISIIISAAIDAQTPDDALRYSFYPQNGSARSMAIGGAIGSLGGDITATFVNPAGIGFYKTNEFVLTPNFFANSNKANYRETTNSSNKNNLGFGTSGWVWGYSSKKNIASSNAVSLSINKTANFNNSIQYTGLNNYSSFAEQFAEEFAKSGYSINQVLDANSPLPYTSAVALYTYLIDTITVSGGIQVKAAPEFILDAHQAIKQQLNKTTSGGSTEIAIAFAHNNNGKWFFGGTIGVPIINYNSNTDFKEFDTSNNTNNHFNKFDYIDNFTTKGFGVNLKLGIIYRLKESIRIGFAIHTPTFMNLTDTRNTFLSAQLENPINTFTVSSDTFTNNHPGQSSYQQATPLKGIISASYVFGEVENTKKQRGFISADVEYINHGSSRFKDKNAVPTAIESAYYNQLNSVIKNQYKGSFNFKVGGELKFNTIMGRLGFAYYGNPYANAPEKINRMLLNGGIGYRNKGMFIDVTYTYSISNNIDFPYRLQDRANTYATLQQHVQNIIATIGFKL